MPPLSEEEEAAIKAKLARFDKEWFEPYLSNDPLAHFLLPSTPQTPFSIREQDFQNAKEDNRSLRELCRRLGVNLDRPLPIEENEFKHYLLTWQRNKIYEKLVAAGLKEAREVVPELSSLTVYERKRIRDKKE